MYFEGVKTRWKRLQNNARVDLSLILDFWIQLYLRAVLNDPNSAPIFQIFENFGNRKEAFFQTNKKLRKLLRALRFGAVIFIFFSDFQTCVAPANKGDIRVSYAVPQVALNSGGSLYSSSCC